MDVRLVLALAASLASTSGAKAAVTSAEVARLAAALVVSWSSPDPIDVYVTGQPDGTPKTAQLLARGARTGAYQLDSAGLTRHYFLLVDERDGQTVETAERVLPLAHGSNFRDLGGYPAADGRHVRWGLVFRSGAQPMLTDTDLAQVRALHLSQLVDLRSSEERVLAPTKIEDVPYSAVGYKFSQLMSPDGQPLHNSVTLYHRLPELLAPQLKIIFDDLLSRRAPIVYNCSAGQDRTGFATAVILSALGVSREIVVRDYLLSTQDRRPEFEMPPINLAAHPGDATAEVFARAQADPSGRKPRPLVEADGRPFLTGAFDEIDGRWGSVDGYLRKVIGLSDADLLLLRQTYLE